MVNLKGFIRGLRQLIENPDGSISTKRSVGIFTLLMAVAVGWYGLLVVGVSEAIFTTVFVGLLGMSTAALGLSSIDYRHECQFKSGGGA